MHAPELASKYLTNQVIGHGCKNRVTPSASTIVKYELITKKKNSQEFTQLLG